MALGKSVGRISVRVIPDATKFRNDLKLLLKRVEQSMSANLAVTADTRPFEAELRKLVKNTNGQSVDLNVGAKTAGFTAHMKVLTRPRRVPISVEITKKSAAQVATFFASLSGARLAGDFVKNLQQRLADLDRDLPKLTSVALGVASIGAAGLNAVHGLGGVLVGLAQLAPLTALLPGGLFGIATGVTTMVLAFKGAPKSIRSALASYKSLQRVVSKNFWADAAKPIRSFLTGILPQLKTGFGELASEMGNDLANVTAVLSAGLGGGVLAKVFDDATNGAAKALPGVNSFTHAFVTLLTTGASFLPAFGGWITKIGQQFDGWLTGIEASGQLDQMIQTSLVVLGQLGSSLVSIGSILNGVFTAGGGDAIGGLAAGLAAVAAIVNSPTFQTALATIFGGAAVGAAGLGAALAPIGQMLVTLAPVIANILSSTGVVVGQVLGQIATALSSPAFSTGLTAFFTGLQTGLVAILPALPALASALGAVGSFAGALASTLGPVLGTVLSALAPILTEILTAIQPLLPVLGTAFIGIVKALAPVVVQLVQALLPLISTIVSQLVPILGPLVDALTPILTPLIQIASTILTALMPLLGPLLQLLAFLVEAGLGPLGDILTALVPVIQLVADAISIFATVVGAIIQTFVDLVTGNFSDIGKVWSGVWDSVQSTAKSAFNSTMTLLQGFINGSIDLLNGLTAGLNDMLDKIKTASGGAINLHIGKIPHVSLPHLAIGADLLAGNGGVPFIGAERGRNERVIDQGLGNKALAVTIALAQRALSTTSGGLPDTMTLVDVDGSILAIAKVIASDAVSAASSARKSNLSTGQQKAVG